MPVFPSRGWAEAAMALVNADPEIVAASRGWQGDFGVVIEAEKGKLDEHFVAWLRPEDGRVAELRVIVDPVEAIVKRRLRVDGDVQPILERMRYKDIAARVLSRLETRFVDE